MSLDDDVREELRQLEVDHRLRVPRIVESAQGPRIKLDGVDVLNFASNDYLSLAADSRLRRAFTAAFDDAGFGAGASRLIVGNHRHHVVLEEALADWFRYPKVRLFNSGYAANIGVLSTLLNPRDVVFSDELNHASIIDGCRLSRAEIVIFPHRDLVTLERRMARHPIARRRIIVSESLFSMDGHIADVEGLSTLARKYEAALILDEAHAIGVLGPEGRGVAAEAGVHPDVLIGTCGKALGSFGAFAASSRVISDILWTRARPLVFSTGLPPGVSAATKAAVDIVRSAEGERRRQALQARISELRDQMPALGAHKSPIVPLVVGDERRAMELTNQLLDARVFVQGIRPPTVPDGTSRLRISLAAGHSAADVSALTTALRRFT